MVGLARLELATSRLSSVRSNQLSYKPSPTDQPQVGPDIKAQSADPVILIKERRNMRATVLALPCFTKEMHQIATLERR